MPHPEDPKNTGFSKYDSMTTHQLQQILWADSNKSAEDTSDTEELLYIMDLLARRRTDPKPPEKALTDFKIHCFTSEKGTPFCGFCRRWTSLAAVMVLVLSIFLSVPGTAKRRQPYAVNPVCDSGYLYLECVGGRHQTDPYWRLYLVTSKDPSAYEEYGSMQECLEAFRITEPLAPKLIPEGYVPNQIQGRSDISGRHFFAAYMLDEEHIIRIRIKDYDPYNPSKSSLSGTQWEEYESNGVTYYLFWNNGVPTAMWINDGFECKISGPVSMEELKMMIDSIGE